jgi:hydroxymethylglutaryl-CoA reductase (NADPH)
VKLPVGIIGPLRINGLNAHGDFHVPMATTEAALVASYGRGALAATRAGGISTALLYEGVIRTPAFVFDDLLSTGMFVDWVVQEIDSLKASAEATTKHGKLVSLEPVIDNNVAFLICRYTTGDAAGQNMVTIATNALCEDIVARCPVGAEGLVYRGQFLGRQEGLLPRPRDRQGPQGQRLGHAAGGGRGEDSRHHGAGDARLRAGRQPRRAPVGPTRRAGAFRKRSRRALYRDGAGRGLRGRKRHGHHADGTAGGGPVLLGHDAQHPRGIGGRRDGTAQPVGGAQHPRPEGAGHGAALAEVTAATCLCGEISIVAAIAAGHFTRAHETLARHR